MHYLACTDSVHTTAAICDYLEERVTTEDTVSVIAVAQPEDPHSRLDAQEALTVAPVRLTEVATLETELLEGEPASTILEGAEKYDVDELVVCVRSGHPDATTDVGSTASAVLAGASRPVVVAPLPEL